MRYEEELKIMEIVVNNLKLRKARSSKNRIENKAYFKCVIGEGWPEDWKAGIISPIIIERKKR